MIGYAVSAYLRREFKEMMGYNEDQQLEMVEEVKKEEVEEKKQLVVG